MVNFIYPSIYIPNWTQLIAIFSTLFNIFLIFRFLEAKGKTNKLFHFIGLFFAAHILFSFLFNLCFGDELTNIDQVWEQIKTFQNDPLYDVIIFNLIFVGFVVLKKVLEICHLKRTSRKFHSK